MHVVFVALDASLINQLLSIELYQRLTSTRFLNIVSLRPPIRRQGVEAPNRCSLHLGLFILNMPNNVRRPWHLAVVSLQSDCILRQK